MINRDERRDRSSGIIHDSEVHFDNLDGLADPDYYASSLKFTHRPSKTQTISHEYPFKHHWYGKQKHASGLYDDYELSSKDAKSAPKEPQDQFQSLSQSTATAKPPHLDMRNEGLMSKFLGKGSIIFRGWTKD